MYIDIAVIKDLVIAPPHRPNKISFGLNGAVIKSIMFPVTLLTTMKIPLLYALFIDDIITRPDIRNRLYVVSEVLSLCVNASVNIKKNKAAFMIGAIIVWL
jgi:hypothetical protein